MTAGAIIGSGILLKAVAPILLTRWTWAFAGVILSLVMTSGYMFTRIRHSPYTGKDGSWIAGGFTNQYGQEVHVIAFVCEYCWVHYSVLQGLISLADGLLGMAFVMLTVVVPMQTSAAKQRMQIYLWTAVIMVIYSVLVSLFRVKNRGTFQLTRRYVASLMHYLFPQRTHTDSSYRQGSSICRIVVHCGYKQPGALSINES